MLIKDIIFEAIQSPLYIRGYEAVSQGIQAWLPNMMALLDQYTNKAQFRYQLGMIPTDQDSNDNWDRRSRLRDDQYDREYGALVREDNPALREKLVATFKEVLEQQLRTAALAYVEEQFGEIERYNTSDPPRYEEIQKLHLYFLQFLIVDIDYTGQHKSGQPRTGGGFFSRRPGNNTWKDSYSQHNVDLASGNSLGFGIKIYTTENKLWLAAVGTIIEKLHIEHFGEPQDKNEGLGNLLEGILPTWVHEVVHLEQTTRRWLKGSHSYKADWGMSYTPMTKARPKFKVYGDTGSREVRGGRRGFPSHLTDEQNIDMSEWIEYFGTAHEIEAHAAGAAAKLIHEFNKNAGLTMTRDVNGNYRQEDLNRNIDSIIQDIGLGFMPYSAGSLNDYYDHIRNEAMRYLRLKGSARDRDMARDPRVLNKVNIGARKVWTIFLAKLVKHLQAYKKPMPTYYNYDRDPRLRTPELPKPNLPG